MCFERHRQSVPDPGHVRQLCYYHLIQLRSSVDPQRHVPSGFADFKEQKARRLSGGEPALRFLPSSLWAEGFQVNTCFVEMATDGDMGRNAKVPQARDRRYQRSEGPSEVQVFGPARHGKFAADGGAGPFDPE